MDMITVALCVMLVGALFFLVLDPSIDDGPVVRTGAAIAAIGLLGVVLREIDGVDSWVGMRSSMRMVFVGGLIVFIGTACRNRWFRLKRSM